MSERRCVRCGIEHPGAEFSREEEVLDVREVERERIRRWLFRCLTCGAVLCIRQIRLLLPEGKGRAMRLTPHECDLREVLEHFEEITIAVRDGSMHFGHLGCPGECKPLYEGEECTSSRVTRWTSTDLFDPSKEGVGA